VQKPFGRREKKKGQVKKEIRPKKKVKKRKSWLFANPHRGAGGGGGGGP